MTRHLLHSVSRAGLVVAAVIAQAVLVISANSATAATPSPTPSASPHVTAAAAPGAAAGASLGALTVRPSTGDGQSVFSLLTTHPCPAGGTNVVGTLLGSGLPSFGLNVVTNTTAALFPRTQAGGYALISNNTLAALIAGQVPSAPPLKGVYRLRVQCRGPAKTADLGDFYAQVAFDGKGTFKAVEPVVPASGLVTLPPVTDPPIPVAPAVTKALASKATAVPKSRAATGAKHSTLGGTAPWLIAVGALLAAFGAGTYARGRAATKRAAEAAVTTAKKRSTPKKATR